METVHVDALCQATPHREDGTRSKHDHCNCYGCNNPPAVTLKVGGGNFATVLLLCAPHALLLAGELKQAVTDQ